MKVYFLITSVIYVLQTVIIVQHLLNGMVLQDGTLSHLDLLLQKSLRYKYHKENHIKKVSGMRFFMTQKRIL